MNQIKIFQLFSLKVGTFELNLKLTLQSMTITGYHVGIKSIYRSA